MLTCKILVAFLFSNLTLKGVNLQKFGGVFFSNLTLKGVEISIFNRHFFQRLPREKLLKMTF